MTILPYFMINPIVLNVLIAAALLAMIAAVSNIILSVLSFAPWVPCRNRDLKRIFRLAGLKSGQNFYDLGCGDGKIVFFAAANFQAKAIGLEILWPLYLICRLKLIFRRGDSVNFKLKNLFKENLSPADAVYFFGMPNSINKKLSVKLKRELKPGTKIISYAFSLAGWIPAAVDKPGPDDLPIYLYIK